MKGKINLASATRKASAKGRLSRAQVGASSREGGGEERGGGGHSTQGNPEKHNRHADTNNTTILNESSIDEN